MKMIDEYPNFVRDLFKPMNNDAEYMMHAAIGIAGEGGELLDACKKHWVYGKPIDRVNVIEELGDTLFYVQAMANKLGISIDDILRHNVLKLRARYGGTKYSDAAAIARKDKQ